MGLDGNIPDYVGLEGNTPDHGGLDENLPHCTGSNTIDRNPHEYISCCIHSHRSMNNPDHLLAAERSEGRNRQ